ncbi:MAG: coenzyme F420-0:L-glutamate ligase [Candidatus Hadarchaeales archaeon]
MPELNKMEVIPLPGFPLVKKGDDIGELIVKTLRSQGFSLQTGDVLVVAQSIVSKAEGAVVDLKKIRPSELAKKLSSRLGKDAREVEVVLREAKEIVRSSHVLITRTEHGFVCANAGVDHSNVEGGRVTLLPRDPDRSAERIRKKIKKELGVEVAVIISDTQGRAFRTGCLGVAIGVSGMKPLWDLRGRKDLYGKELEVTVVAQADAIAAAAVSMMGEAGEGTPVVLVRGAKYQRGKGSARELVRSREKDLFT